VVHRQRGRQTYNFIARFELYESCLALPDRRRQVCYRELADSLRAECQVYDFPPKEVSLIWLTIYRYSDTAVATTTLVPLWRALL